ncbi:ABC transporter ATP-binding protein [Pseudonocardia eucalypti]|uniref:ABC transporter ATP-binding protein n=1 Tax=Pseudonocardia eucalypti TaxID=648755 RepID=A0ABP9RGE1_9PSEU|nr:putative spermidine/putrescine transport system ATP-binding protein [Pseudonocardia eucalypti]
MPGEPRTAGAGASIELRALTKVYDGGPVVDAIDLRIAAGEFVTLLGPSGSGKTTTLNMLAGFVPVSSGEILVDGQRVDDVPTHRRDLGMVFQNYALFPHMSVGENVEYPLRQRRIDRRARHTMVAEALGLVGLDGFARRRPRELSGGQQQRVALARAVVYRPGVLLMDEPLGALDKKLRDQLQLEIRHIHAELGTTFVFVTHDQDEALALSDRIAVFNHGRIEQVGTGEELYESPGSMFVARFLGESTLLPGRSRVDGPASVVEVFGRRVRAERGTPLDAADAVVMLRPERITLVPRSTDDPPAGRNAVPGDVVDQVYLGNARKVLVRLPDGSEAHVREPTTGRGDARPGDPVWLTFDAADATALPNRNGSS